MKDWEDPLAIALMAAGLSEEMAYDCAERAAIIEYSRKIDRRTAELIATGGWEA